MAGPRASPGVAAAQLSGRSLGRDPALEILPVARRRVRRGLVEALPSGRGGPRRRRGNFSTASMPGLPPSGPMMPTSSSSTPCGRKTTFPAFSRRASGPPVRALRSRLLMMSPSSVLQPAVEDPAERPGHPVMSKSLCRNSSAPAARHRARSVSSLEWLTRIAGMAAAGRRRAAGGPPPCPPCRASSGRRGSGRAARRPRGARSAAAPPSRWRRPERQPRVDLLEETAGDLDVVGVVVDDHDRATARALSALLSVAIRICRPPPAPVKRSRPRQPGAA